MAGCYLGRVVEVRSITPRTRAIAIHSETFRSLELPPGIDLIVDTGAGERHYSVVSHEPASGVARLAVVLHGGGPGALWAAHTSIGSEVRFAVSSPQALILDTSATWHVFFGDETSVGSSFALIAAAQGRAEACFEVVDPSDQWPDVVDTKAKWLFRGGTRPGKSAVLFEELAERVVPEGSTVYVTGEAWLCTVVSSHFRRERHFPPEKVRAVPYWKLRPRLPLEIPAS